MKLYGREKLGDLGFLLVVVCAVVLTAFNVHDRLIDPPPVADEASRSLALTPAQWAEATSAGHATGPDDAPVTMVVFSDFECPACRSLSLHLLPRIDSLYPSKVRVLFRHWPLQSHEFAFDAARATECAGAQGRYRELHDALFKNQRAIGAIPFSTFAENANIPDRDAFNACVASADYDAVILRDADLVDRLGGRGTPAVAINGQFFPAGVNRDVLDSILAGVR